jgi:hypothetical protein
MSTRGWQQGEIGHVPKRSDFMRFRYAISFESDSRPVETVRGEFDVARSSQALHQGARVAVAKHPKGRRFRSFVIVVEQLDMDESEMD